MVTVKIQKLSFKVVESRASVIIFLLTQIQMFETFFINMVTNLKKSSCITLKFIAKIIILVESVKYFRVMSALWRWQGQERFL